MDHTEAVNTKAIEKYFLGELRQDEREAFEEHFFDCLECAADVKSTAVLVDNVREVLRTAPAENAKKAPAAEKRSAGFLSWWKPAYSFALIAVLAIALGYQSFVTVPSMRGGGSGAAVALPSYSFVTAGSRGGAGMEIAVPAKSPFGIYVDIPSSGGFQSYEADVVTAGGEQKLAIPVTADQAKDTVQLLVPAGLLRDGEYNLVIRGLRGNSAPSEEVIRHPFSLRTK